MDEVATRKFARGYNGTRATDTGFLGDHLIYTDFSAEICPINRRILSKASLARNILLFDPK